jgi:hypothetical protein
MEVIIRSPKKKKHIHSDENIRCLREYSQIAMRTYDVYANILKCMYSTRFNGGATGSEASADVQMTPCVDTALTHPINSLPQPDKYKRRKKENPKERDK